VLLGARGYGSEGSLQRFVPYPRNQKALLVDAARQCQQSGFYDKVM
jgi:nuclear pore complex protein Nup93